MTPAAARKAISRSTDPAVWVLPFYLPHRARLFARREYVQHQDFYTALATNLTKDRPGLARTIRVLLARRILLKADAQRLLAAPLRPKLRTPHYEKEVTALVDLRLCAIEDSGTPFERLTVHPLVGTPQSYQHARSEHARQFLNTRLTRMITDQFRKQNIVSWNKVIHANETGPARFSDYAFSAFGYSWLAPLKRMSAGKQPQPTPVLFDVFSRECDVHDVEGFGHRLRRVASGRATRIPLLGVTAAHTFTNDAWNAAKEQGLLAINLRHLYGATALKALAKMEHLIGTETAQLPGQRASAADYDELADDLEALRVHPNVVALRSLSLEILAAVLLRALGWEDVQLGRKVIFKDTEREVDVIGKQGGGDNVYVVECKAAHAQKNLEPEDVYKFFRETVPAVLKCFPNAKKCNAELWTTGRVGKEADEKLRTLSLTNRVQPQLRDKYEIEELVPSTLSPCKRLIDAISG